MQVRYSKTVLWIGYCSIAFLVFAVGKGVLDVGVHHESFWRFVGGSGPAPTVTGVFALLVAWHTLGKHDVVVIVRGDEALGYRAGNKQWTTLPDRAMREARVVTYSYRQRDIFRLRVTMNDGQEITIERNSLARSAGEIFHALKAHLPHMTQPDPKQPTLVLAW